MTPHGHSFIDLTALPEVGALLLSPRPAWLWSLDNHAILWTNVAGAAKLGLPAIADALDADPTRWLAKPDLGDLGDQLSMVPRMAGLPLSGSDSIPVWCLCTRLDLGDGAIGLLAVVADGEPVSDPLAVRAGRLVQSVAGDEMTAAIVRPDGRVVAASAGFAGLPDGERVIAGVADKIGSDDERRLKRTRQFGEERRLVGATRATTPDGEFVLVIVGPAEPRQATAAPTHEKPDQETVDHRASADQSGRAPRRFTFKIDADRRVADLSPEFAFIAGPNMAELVGKQWDEVADRFGLDQDGVISTALARRDTWSGVNVNWPAADGNGRVSIDLTALPTFGEGGAFEGFRGFGVLKLDVAGRGGSIPQVEPEDLPQSSTGGDDATPSNVVRLPSATGRLDPNRANLSVDEQDAFRRIAEALRAAGPAASQAVEATLSNERFRTAPVPAAEAAPTPLSIPPQVLDRVPVGLLVYRDRSVLYANRALLDRLGYPDVAALAMAGGVDGLLAPPVTQPSETAGAGHRFGLRTADGNPISVVARLHVVPWDDGSATMLSIGDFADADQNPPSGDWETTIARIEELEAVLDTATDGVLVVNASGHILKVNRTAEALFGVDEDDVAGRPFTELLAEESHRDALDYLDGLARAGVASVLNDGREVIGRVPTGGLIPLFMTMGRLSERGKFCAVLRDITQWKRAEEELVAARRTAEIANQQKSDFLAKISHEIRTPLTAIIGFSDVILEERFGPIGGERYREYLKDIRLSGTHLMSLINDLLDLSKIESGNLELSFSAVAANQIVQECVALMQPEANRKKIIIRTSLAADVPKIVADERSLRQIILNLLSNAVKFNPAGGQVIVSTALEKHGEVVLRIRDTGIGMSKSDIESAMKPFQQIGSAGAARFEGTGLGLPLTKALVEANRAGFSIDSAPNEGTLVRINFPIERVLQA